MTTPSITRREAVRHIASATAGAWLAGHSAFALSTRLLVADDSVPPLAPGAPTSAERLALIDAFKKKSEGLDKKYEARAFKSDWTMPYRLFRPAQLGKLPLVLYLHGSGGLGDDNLKQLALGNVFGTRVWLLPENQKNFPCYVVAPQTDRGWIRYDVSHTDEQGRAKTIPGLGDGARVALELVDSLCHEFSIDERRIYVMGQSMGGAGVWHMTAQRPKRFAAAVACCGSPTADDASASASTPLWNFHGDADQTVPVQFSRDRITAMRSAGGHPIYTEYPKVDHNVWEWAFTEPALGTWLFAQRRA